MESQATETSQKISDYLEEIAAGAEDVFAQVGIVLTPQEMRRINNVFIEILVSRLPLPAEVMQLILNRSKGESNV